MKKIILFAFIALLNVSCKSDRECKIERTNNESKQIFELAIHDDVMANIPSNLSHDSLKKIYTKLSLDSAELALIFSKRIDSLLPKLRSNIYYALEAREKELQAKSDEEELQEFKKTKAYKIFVKHPEWSKEDCERLANKEYWIGMELDMVKFLRGLPDAVNVSDYGNGKEYQWCWHGKTPFCFYGKEGGIITSYN
jgi:hypothetical protein